MDDTTKGLPIVGGVTSPLLKTVGGVTDGLPVVSSTKSSSRKRVLTFDSQVGANGQQAQAQPKTQKPRKVLTEAEQKEKKKRALALKKKQLELEAAELEMSD